MNRIIVEVISQHTRRKKLITGKETDRYFRISEKLGIPIEKCDGKTPKLTLRYYPGTFPEYDTDDDLDVLLG